MKNDHSHHSSLNDEQRISANSGRLEETSSDEERDEEVRHEVNDVQGDSEDDDDEGDISETDDEEAEEELEEEEESESDDEWRARMENEMEEKLSAEHEKTCERLRQTHISEVHDIKDRHNDKVETLLSKLSDANLRYVYLRLIGDT